MSTTPTAPLRIVQLSDIHGGRQMPTGYLEEAIERVKAIGAVQSLPLTAN